MGRPRHRHYVKSWKETVVYETVEKSSVCQDEQLCDLFSNMRAHVGRQALRKNRRNYLHHALRVISGNIPYDEARCICNILSLAERRHEPGKIFFSENYQGQVERPLVSSASQARCSTNDLTV